MGELTAFSIEGMKIWFWSKDHNPPHFHVKRDGQWEYRVFFLEVAVPMFERQWGKLLSRADRRLLTEKVIQHRDEIFREWEEKVQQ